MSPLLADLLGRRLQGLAGRTLNPRQVHNFADVTVDEEKWDAMATDFEESTGTAVPAGPKSMRSRR